MPSILVSEIPEITYKALQPIMSEISFKQDQTLYTIGYSHLDREVYLYIKQ